MTGEAGGDKPGRAADGRSAGRRVFANFSFLLAAQAVASLAGLVSTAWLARALGTEAYGILGFGTAILAYFGLAVVAGTDVYGMREIAQNLDRVAVILRRILGLRIVLLAAALLVFLLAAPLVTGDARTLVVLRIQGIGLFATAFAFDFVFQGAQRMGPVAARQALAALLSLAGVLLLIRGPGDIYFAAAIPVTAIALSTIWLAFRLHRQVTPVVIAFEVSHWRPILFAALPILVSQAVNAVYYQMDILMLGLMATPAETGVYVGMSRLYAMAVMLGGLLGTAFSPALAGAWSDAARMRVRYREFLTACVFVGAPITAAVALWPNDVIVTVFGAAFVEGRTALIVLMAAALLTYASYPVAAALLLWHDQKVEVVLMTLGGALNIGLNLWLIPRYGIEGAAAATLASQGLLLVALCARLRLRFGLWELGPAVGLAIVAAAVFAVIALVVAAGFALPGPPWAAFIGHAGAGAVLYGVVATALGLVKPSQMLRQLRRRQN